MFISGHSSTSIPTMASELKNDTRDLFFCLLLEANSRERSQKIAIAGVASTILSFVPLPGHDVVTASGVYDAYSPVECGKVISDVAYPEGTLRRVALSYTFNTVTLFRYSLQDGYFRVQFATSDELPDGLTKLSTIVADSDYITITTTRVAAGLRLESYRAFELELSPTRKYKPKGENVGEDEELQDRCILSEYKGKLKKFLDIGPPPPHQEFALGNPAKTSENSDRGTHLLLIQKSVPAPDGITSIELATEDSAQPYVYLWILRGKNSNLFS